MRTQRSNKSHGGSTLRAFFPYRYYYYYCYSTIRKLLKVRERDTPAKVFDFLICSSVPLSTHTHIHTPFYHFLICSPYVLGHRDQVFLFFVLLYSLAQKRNRGDQQLATSFSFTLRWLLFKAKENITTRTLMVPRCEEETRRIYTISYVREHVILFFTYKT
jgi:hypothetical protein